MLVIKPATSSTVSRAVPISARSAAFLSVMVGVYAFLLAVRALRSPWAFSPRGQIVIYFIRLCARGPARYIAPSGSVLKGRTRIMIYRKLTATLPAIVLTLTGLVM